MERDAVGRKEDAMTDKEIVLDTLRDVANGINDVELGKLSNEVTGRHPHISLAAFDKIVKELETSGLVIVARQAKQGSLLPPPTIHLTEQGLVAADKARGRV
jgi:hypothetical protein